MSTALFDNFVSTRQGENLVLFHSEFISRYIIAERLLLNTLVRASKNHNMYRYR